MECDFCVIFDDFRFDTYSKYLAAMTATRNIVSAVKATHGIFGVLGNHDYNGEISLLLPHTPEIYSQAEEAGVDYLAYRILKTRCDWFSDQERD